MAEERGLTFADAVKAWIKESEEKQSPGAVIALELDLLKLSHLGGEEAMEEICRLAEVDRQDVVFVWASVPCETCSMAN